MTSTPQDSTQNTHLVVIHHLHTLNVAIFAQQLLQIFLSSVETESKHTEHPTGVGVVL